MNWYNQIIKTSIHDDTFFGQFFQTELESLLETIPKLRKEAMNKDTLKLLPRWKEDICRQIFQLPNEDILENMSMIELKQVKAKVNEIQGLMNLRSLTRYEEIIGNGQS